MVGAPSLQQFRMIIVLHAACHAVLADSSLWWLGGYDDDVMPLQQAESIVDITNSLTSPPPPVLVEAVPVLAASASAPSLWEQFLSETPRSDAVSSVATAPAQINAVSGESDRGSKTDTTPASAVHSPIQCRYWIDAQWQLTARASMKAGGIDSTGRYAIDAADCCLRCHAAKIAFDCVAFSYNRVRHLCALHSSTSMPHENLGRPAVADARWVAGAPHGGAVFMLENLRRPLSFTTVRSVLARTNCE